MLAWDPAKRPSASQVLTHPYFQKSIKSSSSQVWGDTSIREKLVKQKSIAMQQEKPFQDPREKVVNIQNKQKTSLADMDNDWDDLDYFATPKAQGGFFSKNKDFSSLAGQQQENSAFPKTLNNQSGVYSALNLKNDLKPSEKPVDESLDAFDDIFDKPPANTQKPGGGVKLMPDSIPRPSPGQALFEDWADEL